MWPEKSRLREAALEYWEMGFNIVLVKGKQPLHDWKQWQNQKQSFEEFRALPWDKADGFAVICGTGHRKDGLYLAVVDFDVKNTSAEAQAKGKEALKNMRITRIEKTPSGGQHWIYLSNKKPRSISAYHEVAALELLGEGKICIMASSKGYRRLNDNPPTVVYDVEAMFYDALKAVGIKLTSNNIVDSKAKFWFDREDLASKPYKGKHPACIQGLLKGVNQGLRNEACIRLACYFANFRMMDVKKVWKTLVEWNRLNNPPLEERELRSVFESALRGKYVYGCTDDLLSKYCVGRAECPLGAGNLGPLELIEHELEQQHAIKLHPLIAVSYTHLTLPTKRIV